MKLPRIGLYSRFFVLFALTTLLLAISIALGTFVISEDAARDFLRERNSHIYTMLNGALEKPTIAEELKEKVKGAKVHVQIIRDGVKTATSDNFPPVEELLLKAEKIGDLYLAKHRSKYYLVTSEERGSVVITSPLLNLIIYPNWLVFWPWLMAIVVICISYQIVRHYLRPIAEALKSAQNISQGQFDYQIKNHPKTELADLTHGLNSMAGELQRLFDAKNELLLAISHELRTPLARMGISVAMLEDSQQARELKNDIHQMDTLIEQLLEGERLQHGHKVLHLSQYFIPTLIEELIEEQDIQGKIELANPTPEAVLSIDVGRIKFLLRNLVLNAIQHADQQPDITLSVSEHDNHLMFEVTDNGPGIPAESLGKIFDPFFCVENTTHRDTQGTGLGLYLCQRIAQAHGGELLASSEMGKGSRFRLALPLHPHN